MDGALNATVARVRIALVQSEAVARLKVEQPVPNPPRRRRRSTVTAVYAGNKDGVPLFAKQKVVRVV
ncbi:hypothetical protein MMYC01_204019 [Madurella mycetomatis]|uniref:Uncharacterized protein n=1 Tax=Madurella mycetomatis TaxID=100816 RepID=A0A175W5Q5_9PEZI|nr:hypothetical protein MMYC01_204019 [Madurella mycetomatis]